MPQREQLSCLSFGGNVLAVLMIAWVEQGSCFQRVSSLLPAGSLLPSSSLYSGRSACRLSYLARTKTQAGVRMCEGAGGEKYKNPLIAFLGTLLPDKGGAGGSPIDRIDFSVPKRRGLAIEVMAQELAVGLFAREWFVTGQVLPELFSERFSFQDPDVKLKGIENYARGVHRIFNQDTARAEVITCSVNASKTNTITVTWRLSGRVNVGPGVEIKPYIVYTDLQVDPSDGLVVFQEDRFALPGWDLALSAFFPFLRPYLAAPAPPADLLRLQALQPGGSTINGGWGCHALGRNKFSGP